jgi:hypothetical protein
MWQGTWIRAGIPAGPTVGHVCQEIDIATTRWGALVCRALGDGVAVAGITVRLALVPWQVVQVILEELVASRPVLVALQAEAIKMCWYSSKRAWQAFDIWKDMCMIHFNLPPVNETLHHKGARLLGDCGSHLAAATIQQGSSDP